MTSTDRTQAVPMCKLRPGDVIAFCSGITPDAVVSVAEYRPVGGVVAFRIGTLVDGETHFIPRIGWGRSNPGTFSWGDRAYVAADAAETIKARVSLFHEVYPEQP